MRRYACAALLALSGSLSLPLAAETGTTFQVTASIVQGCLVVGGGSDYGGINYGTYAALTTGLALASLANGVQLQCTPGTTLSMSIDGGYNNDGGRNLKLNGGTAQLPYQLYSDIGLSQPLDIDQSINVAYSNPNIIRLPIYGRVVLPGTQPAGTYTDVLQVTLSW